MTRTRRTRRRTRWWTLKTATRTMTADPRNRQSTCGVARTRDRTRLAALCPFDPHLSVPWLLQPSLGVECHGPVPAKCLPSDLQDYFPAKDSDPAACQVRIESLSSWSANWCRICSAYFFLSLLGKNLLSYHLQGILIDLLCNSCVSLTIC